MIRPPLIACLLYLSAFTLDAQQRPRRSGTRLPDRARATPSRRAADTSTTLIRVLIAQPTDRSVVLNILAARDITLRVRYGPDSLHLTDAIGPLRLQAGTPTEIPVRGLGPNQRYAYRVLWREGNVAEQAEPIAFWQTQRAPGTPFVFTVQGDSHPEREGRMFDPALYRRTLDHVRLDAPDFHVLLGDDFSIEQLISRGMLTGPRVDAVYDRQRTFLDVASRSSTIIPVNGNHEEAGRFLLDGTPTSAPVLAGSSRNRFFSPPTPDGFYTGDMVPVPHLGLPRDYFAWTWGDALFVVIDPYWHTPPSASPAERPTASSGGNAMQAAGIGRDMWQMTLGDEQYAWLSRTLQASKARWKFVFAHHVLGTGRGGVELADSYEWGGGDRRGRDLFRQYRPGWAMPIHQLFVKTGVTVFFQGHDHLFARQEKDGVVYQSTPNPADPTYTAFNRDAYHSGDVLPNSGHLRVQVSPASVQVEYVRSFLSVDADRTRQDGRVAFSYRIK